MTWRAIIHIEGRDGTRRIELKGRDLWALCQLVEAGPRGCTPIDNPGPRWSAYVFNLRRAGLDIETAHMGHKGAFPGTHGRYVLRSSVRIEWAYLELHSRYWGGNNGKLSLSLEEGARLLGLGKNTVRRALLELVEKGFIALMKRGQFVGRRASEYRLTAKSCDGHPPTRDWERWRPGGPVNSEPGSEVAHIGLATVPFQNRGGKLCAV